VAADRGEVIFVGGTPFSGAEAVARAIAGHPAAAGPLCARFHSEPWGLGALLHGRIGLDGFAERLRGAEIAEHVPAQRLDSALAHLRDRYHEDPLDACRELFWTILSELVDDSAGRPVVEASPGNLAEAQTLLRLVPDARFVHVVRDGRDVAAAAVEANAGVSRMAAALEWWADELREVERGVRGEEDGAPYAIPDERLNVVVLDELTAPRGGAVFRRLMDRLSLGDPALAEATVNLDCAALGRGRWRNHARGPGRWWLARRYERTLGELEAESNHAAPALRHAYEQGP
jgi:hypothetical protein